jgi:uncharacterized protein (DUF1697 family)
VPARAFADCGGTRCLAPGHLAEGILASAAHDAVGAAAGSRATVRNWRTVLKLRALVESG